MTVTEYSLVIPLLSQYLVGHMGTFLRKYDRRATLALAFDLTPSPEFLCLQVVSGLDPVDMPEGFEHGAEIGTCLLGQISES
jgi:hypothetical protein